MIKNNNYEATVHLKSGVSKPVYIPTDMKFNPSDFTEKIIFRFAQRGFGKSNSTLLVSGANIDFIEVR